MSGTPVSAIRNLGPAFEDACTAAGIPDAESLRALGAHEAYRKLLLAGQRPHFIGYYVLHMALQGRPWNDCKGAEKDALRAQFDGLKAETKAPAQSALDKILNEIGVIAKPEQR
ncbi:competence protein TfoX [Antarctobacter heliothermus]|uniref:Competence protein TfoX n=1 Tax=Antarctobacter heliothermus TaxID=74033 RepID=A0A222E631_9RHOB|nr:TfoX/Sxy family protein [Antarctobacter heliothermus]ASP21667.1 competence protein TfoX [Antarctobacter heliothermus]MBT55831.1 competence protein TfoX [Mameliella sp.]|tara:strand:- start:4011 stop:4352 length:342 start_codon:yes stop_codon:yes gene_type:complete